MSKRGPSITDIAHLAGVSKSTVSNVLNGTGRVSEETRTLVLEIAKREGYVVNAAARSLRAQESKTVGILTPDVSNSFLSSIVLHIERSLYEEGYTSFVCDTENNPEREASYIRSMQQKQVDGLIFVNGTHALDFSTIPEGLPVVAIDRKIEGAHASSVCVENDARAMAHDMTATLVRHGCECIAFLIVSTSEVPTEQGERYLGYLEALAEAGLRLDRRLILRGFHERPSSVEAYGLVERLLIDGVAFDGIVAMGDRIAIGALEALKAHDVGVGTSVRVIGCDDSLFCRITDPHLSSVKRNVETLAEESTSSLLALMRGEEPDRMHIVVPHEVVERTSTLG